MSDNIDEILEQELENAARQNDAPDVSETEGVNETIAEQVYAGIQSTLNEQGFEGAYNQLQTLREELNVLVDETETVFEFLDGSAINAGPDIFEVSEAVEPVSNQQQELMQTNDVSLTEKKNEELASTDFDNEFDTEIEDINENESDKVDNAKENDVDVTADVYIGQGTQAKAVLDELDRDHPNASLDELRAELIKIAVSLRGEWSEDSKILQFEDGSALWIDADVSIHKGMNPLGIKEPDIFDDELEAENDFDEEPDIEDDAQPPSNASNLSVEEQRGAEQANAPQQPANPAQQQSPGQPQMAAVSSPGEQQGYSVFKETGYLLGAVAHGFRIRKEARNQAKIEALKQTAVETSNSAKQKVSVSYDDHQLKTNNNALQYMVKNVNDTAEKIAQTQSGQFITSLIQQEKTPYDDNAKETLAKFKTPETKQLIENYVGAVKIMQEHIKTVETTMGEDEISDEEKQRTQDILGNMDATLEKHEDLIKPLLEEKDKSLFDSIKNLLSEVREAIGQAIQKFTKGEEQTENQENTGPAV